MKGYGSFWVLVVLLALLSVLIHLAAWKWAVMRRLKARARGGEGPPSREGPPPAGPAPS